MKFVLILTIYASNGSNYAAAIETIEFNDIKSCMIAGNDWLKHQRNHSVILTEDE